MYFRLKDLREDADKSQKEIGEAIGTSTAYYGAYENGKRELPFYRAIEIANYYKVSLDYLAGLTNDKGGLHCNVLDQDEKKLLNNWKKLNQRQKNIILMNMEEFIEETPSRNVRKSSI